VGDYISIAIGAVRQCKLRLSPRRASMRLQSLLELISKWVLYASSTDSDSRLCRIILLCLSALPISIAEEAHSEAGDIVDPAVVAATIPADRPSTSRSPILPDDVLFRVRDCLMQNRQSGTAARLSQ